MNERPRVDWGLGLVLTLIAMTAFAVVVLGWKIFLALIGIAVTLLAGFTVYDYLFGED